MSGHDEAVAAVKRVAEFVPHLTTPDTPIIAPDGASIRASDLMHLLAMLKALAPDPASAALANDMLDEAIKLDDDDPELNAAKRAAQEAWEELSIMAAEVFVGIRTDYLTMMRSMFLSGYVIGVSKSRGWL